MLRTSVGATTRVDKCKGTFHREMTERIPRTMITSITNIVSHIYLPSMQTKLHIMDICACLSLSESKDEDNNYKKQKSP
jgi:hypothetical protein